MKDFRTTLRKLFIRREQEAEHGISVLIEVLQEQGKSCEDIENILREKYGLSQKDIHQYIERYKRL